MKQLIESAWNKRRVPKDTRVRSTFNRKALLFHLSFYKVYTPCLKKAGSL